MNNNNNRNNNNRRRGRSNRPSTGGQQLNRIDSRARGNAPQLLEKYRKLAQDAHLNGDRVQAEYYLQFADHYFRVIADQRKTQDEQRARREDRWEGGAEDTADGDDFSADSDFPSFDQPIYHRREREERPQERTQERQQDRPRNEDRPRREERVEPDVSEPRAESGDEAPAQDAPRNRYEPAENPFVREPSGQRGLRPRREDRRPRRDAQDAGGNASNASDAAIGIDPSILPPPIALSPTDLAADDLPPAPKRRGRPRKAAASEDGEALAPVDQD